MDATAAQECAKKRFFDLADRLAHTKDRKEQQRLKEELARLIFGERLPDR
jgi:hypothetical protein